jgi:hypothetical protein
MNYFSILGVKPLLKISIFTRLSNYDTVSQAGIQDSCHFEQREKSFFLLEGKTLRFLTFPFTMFRASVHRDDYDQWSD